MRWKSIINIRRSSICWRGRRGTDNGRQKTRNHGYDVIVSGELFTDYSDHPHQTCHAKPKTQINRRRTLPASFPLVGCLPQAAWPERLRLRKVRTLWHCSRWGVALYLWLIVVISVRQSTVAAISRLHCRALVMVSSSIRLTAWLQIQRSGRNGQRDWCMSRVTAIISALVICIIVCLSWAVSHYRDNAITYKAQRDKKCQRTEAGERGNYWRADASAWCCCARCKIHEELADAEAENDALRDGVPLVVVGCTSKQSVSQCVKPPPPPAWIMQPPPTGRHRWTGLFHPQRGWSLCKNNWRNPEVY